jgi:hypothetical protein
MLNKKIKKHQKYAKITNQKPKTKTKIKKILTHENSITELIML